MLHSGACGGLAHPARLRGPAALFFADPGPLRERRPHAEKHACVRVRDARDSEALVQHGFVGVRSAWGFTRGILLALPMRLARTHTCSANVCLHSVRLKNAQRCQAPPLFLNAHKTISRECNIHANVRRWPPMACSQIVCADAASVLRLSRGAHVEATAVARPAQSHPREARCAIWKQDAVWHRRWNLKRDHLEPLEQHRRAAN